jgi:hypothetical protein
VQECRSAFSVEAARIAPRGHVTNSPFAPAKGLFYFVRPARTHR